MMFYDCHNGVTFFLDVISLKDRSKQSHIGVGSAPGNRDSEGFMWARVGSQTVCLNGCC